MTSNKSAVARYRVSLHIKHPTMDPDAITSALGLEPIWQWKVGDPRRTPTGTPLSGNYRDTYWNFSKKIDGEKYFFEGLLALMEMLVDKGDFLRNISQTNGSLAFVIQLPGDINMGDVVSADVLGKISALNASLSVEVFPKFN